LTQPAPESPPQALLTLSMKGGVGKTTTAIGLVKALHRWGHKVADCYINFLGILSIIV
jgi:Mrp family chromosome partitioning ATPase